MKYLDAYLKEKKFLAHSQGNELTELTKGGEKGLLSVLSVPSGTNASGKNPYINLAGSRDFLSRPLGHEEHSDGWDAWVPFMDWLLVHHPEHYHAICEAEDALTTLEKEGMTDGAAYDIAWEILRQRFETARALAQKEQRSLQSLVQ